MSPSRTTRRWYVSRFRRSRAWLLFVSAVIVDGSDGVQTGTVQVAFVVQGLEEHIDERTGLVHEKHFQLLQADLSQFVGSFVFFDQRHYVLGQRLRIGVASGGKKAIG